MNQGHSPDAKLSPVMAKIPIPVRELMASFVGYKGLFICSQTSKNREPLGAEVIDEFLQVSRMKQVIQMFHRGLLNKQDLEFLEQNKIKGETIAQQVDRYLSRHKKLEVANHRPRNIRAGRAKQEEKLVKISREEVVLKVAISGDLSLLEKYSIKDLTKEEVEDACDTHGRSAVRIAYERGKKNNYKALEFFYGLPSQANVNRHPLEIAIIYYRGTNQLEDLFAKEKTQNGFNYTHWICCAAQCGNFEALRMFVEDAEKNGWHSKVFAKIARNFSVGGKSVDLECNVFHLAALSGPCEMVEYLREKSRIYVAQKRVVFKAEQPVVQQPQLPAKGSPESKQDQSLADVACVTDSMGQTPLHYAALQGHFDVVLEMLEKNPQLVNVPDKKGNTPLLNAIRNADVKTIYALLKFNAKKDLDLAGMEFSKEFLLFLLEHDIGNARYRILHSVIFFPKGDVLNNPEHDKIYQQYPQFFPLNTRAVFAQRKTDADIAGETVLHTACKNLNLRVMSELLTKDPTLINNRDDNGETPLFYLIKGIKVYAPYDVWGQNKSQLLQVLKECKDIDIATPNSKQKTISEHFDDTVRELRLESKKSNEIRIKNEKIIKALEEVGGCIAQFCLNPSSGAASPTCKVM